MNFEAILFYVLLVDSIGANIAAWFHVGEGWYRNNFRTISRYFPLSRGWTTYYFVLVLWIGWILYQSGTLL